MELCPVCLFPQFPVDLQLRGVCLDSQVDKFYILHSNTELRGHTGSVLRSGIEFIVVISSAKTTFLVKWWYVVYILEW